MAKRSLPVNETETEKEVVEKTKSKSTIKNKIEKDVYGTTTATLLRVRKEPNIESDVVCTIKAGTELKIIQNESTKDFYKVVSAVGFEGFCMKKFIALK